jgi:hypothetical protein
MARPGATARTTQTGGRTDVMVAMAADDGVNSWQKKRT